MCVFFFLSPLLPLLLLPEMQLGALPVSGKAVPGTCVACAYATGFENGGLFVIWERDHSAPVHMGRDHSAPVHTWRDHSAPAHTAGTGGSSSHNVHLALASSIPSLFLDVFGEKGMASRGGNGVVGVEGGGKVAGQEVFGAKSSDFVRPLTSVSMIHGTDSVTTS